MEEDQKGLIYKDAHNAVRALALFLLVLTLLFAVKVIGELKAYTFIGEETLKATITVTGEGEIFASPDIATLSVAVEMEKPTVAEAQKEATEKINSIIAFLKESDVEDKDVRTENYSIYPQYEYVQVYCITYPCPPGKNELRGYRVSQNLSVIIRAKDFDSLGRILAGVGERGATNVNGPNFTIEEEGRVLEQAREIAIKNAIEKAEALADDLDVDLVKIIEFSEGNMYPMYARLSIAEDEGYGKGGGVPEVPVGENKIVSNVTIRYEIR